MEKLLDKLRTLNIEKKCPQNCLEYVDDSLKVLEKLFQLGYSKLDMKERGVLLDLVHQILMRCPKFKELWSAVSSYRLASVGGNPIIFQMSRKDFFLLMNLTVERVRDNISIHEKSKQDPGMIIHPELRSRAIIRGIERVKTEEDAIPLYESEVEFGEFRDTVIRSRMFISGPLLEEIRRQRQMHFILPLSSELSFQGTIAHA